MKDATGNDALLTLNNVDSTTNVKVDAGAQSVTASAALLTPGVGEGDAITLTVKDSTESTVTAFSGAHNVTVTGYVYAPDGTYGSFNGTLLTASPNTSSVTFTNGTATVNLKLNNAAEQTLNFSVSDVQVPGANAITLTPVAGRVASLQLTTDITAPPTNGGMFAQQPVVTLLDAYGETRVWGDSSTVVDRI